MHGPSVQAMNFEYRLCDDVELLFFTVELAVRTADTCLSVNVTSITSGFTVPDKGHYCNSWPETQ